MVCVVLCLLCVGSACVVFVVVVVVSCCVCDVLCVSYRREGDVAQMVERSLSMREVLGSIPSFSTSVLLL